MAKIVSLSSLHLVKNEDKNVDRMEKTCLSGKLVKCSTAPRHCQTASHLISCSQATGLRIAKDAGLPLWAIEKK